jgi:PiT family inorganic phosphate transporter
MLESPLFEYSLVYTRAEGKVSSRKSMDPSTLVLLTIVLVVAFDFSNGFHDASNMVATIVASRALTPAQSIGMISLFSFLGPILGGTAVADTMGGFVQLADLDSHAALVIIAAGLGGALVWNLLTWRWGIPSSSSHALVGGLCGAVGLGIGLDHIVWGFDALRAGHLVGICKITAALLFSPLLGFAVAFLLQRFMIRALAGATPRANRTLRRAQWATAASLAFSHGTNDAQKGMGILTLVLMTGGLLPDFEVPFWVIVVCASAITLGTLTGGWRIVRTLGFGIYRIRPLHGFDSQLASAAIVFAAGLTGGPVSTTHVVSSSIMGVGAAERPRAVRWGKAGEIVMTWIVTLPGAAIMGAAIFGIVQVLEHVIA